MNTMGLSETPLLKELSLEHKLALPNIKALLEKIVALVKQLTPEYRVYLIQLIAQTMIQPRPTSATSSQLLQFGEYKGDTIEEDFVLAEWHPTAEELNGN